VVPAPLPDCLARLLAEPAPGPQSRWRYLEHDWVATEGSYVYEAPGETHTLVVDEHVEEMITLFQVNGAMIYVDPDGRVQGYEDVFTKIDRHVPAALRGDRPRLRLRRAVHPLTARRRVTKAPVPSR
jgi:hypothetical protein